MDYAVETQALTKRYTRQRALGDVLRGRAASDTLAVNGVTLAIEQGEIFGLLGPNGSGKTTFLKLLSTILAPSSGTARIFGHDVVREPRAVRSLVALVTGEERSLYWRLTGRQNLEFFLKLYGIDGRRVQARLDELLELFVLTDVKDVRVAEYSTGMRQKLAIARGLLTEPRLLFLDEPTRGLDPAAAHNLLNLVRDRAVERFENTIVLTTHIAREVEQLCTRIATLHRGRVSYLGSVQNLGASIDPFSTYSFTVSGLSDAALDRLRLRAGVQSCTRVSSYEGLVEFEIVFAREAIALSEVLRHLLFSNVEIVRCTARERSLEETFRTVFDHPVDNQVAAAVGD
jgi:ABC-2 type transport system ATP-binding protein